VDGGLVHDEKFERYAATGWHLRRNQSLDRAPCREEEHDLYNGVTNHHQTLRYSQPCANEARTAVTYRNAGLVYYPLVPRNIRRELPTVPYMRRSRVPNSTDLSLLGTVRNQPDTHGVNDCKGL